MPMPPIVSVAAMLTVWSTLAAAQPRDDHMTMHHGGTAMFVVQASAAKVVPASNSTATATGAFLINRERGSFSYEVTYQDLRSGRPQLIGLYNFGAGGNGALIHVICGDGAQQCPDAAFGNL